MIDADADVLTAHSDEPIQTADVSRVNVASLRRTLFKFRQRGRGISRLSGGSASTSFIRVDLFSQSKILCVDGLSIDQCFPLLSDVLFPFILHAITLCEPLHWIPKCLARPDHVT